ncbi:MAG: cupin protein [Sphingomonas bacterium]|nr:cupin protein [Sphingomonas bacterium]
MFFRKRKAADRRVGNDLAVTTPFHRIVTGHDRGGWSILQSVDTLRPVTTGAGDVAFAEVWATPEVPANLNDGSDGGRVSGDTGGSMIRVVDFLPGRKSRMHRSWSIDYAIVLDGEIELQLDSGEVQHLDTGDIVVQRGTNHLWRNPGTEPCRVVFILIEAVPVAVNGQLLPEVQP